MQINLTGHHVDITEPLKGYVDTKFDRLARHFDDVINVHVILSVEKLRQKAEATHPRQRRQRVRRLGARGHVRGHRRVDRQARPAGDQVQGKAPEPPRQPSRPRRAHRPAAEAALAHPAT
jgi:hypothetical protein